MLEEALKYVADTAKAELRRQGHYLTGKTEQSFEIQIDKGVDTEIGRILVDVQAIYLDKGVKPERVPYGGGGGGGKSKYIEALLEYVKRRKPGISDREAKGFAFAIARKAKQTGHPTPGSYAFSQSGQRLGWIESTADQVENNIEQLLNLPQFIIGIIENKVDEIRRILT